MKPVHILLCCVATSKVNLQSESAEVDRKPFGRPARSSVLILMELIGVRERVGTAHYSLFNAQLSCNGISHLSRCLLRDKCKHWKVYRAKLNYNGIHQALHCLFFFTPCDFQVTQLIYEARLPSMYVNAYMWTQGLFKAFQVIIHWCLWDHQRGPGLVSVVGRGHTSAVRAQREPKCFLWFKGISKSVIESSCPYSLSLLGIWPQNLDSWPVMD